MTSLSKLLANALLAASLMFLAACGGRSDPEPELAASAQAIAGDHDNDGIPDDVDLDDDNDGIRDAVECSAPSLAGSEFWILFNPNVAPEGRRDIHAAGPPGTQVTIGSFPVQTIPASGFLTFDTGLGRIPTSGVVESGKALSISSTAPVQVFGNNFEEYTVDAFAVVPVQLLGTEYYAAGYPGYLSQISVFAIEDNTSVTIGAAAPITLDRGQSFLREQVGDATGIHITSNKPIGVNTGDLCLSTSGICDHVEEMLFPVASWASDFFVPVIPQPQRYRVVAATNNTTVQVNGTTVATLNAGAFYQGNGGGVRVQTSAPAEVYIIALGDSFTDPSFILLPGAQNGVASTRFGVLAADYANTVAIAMPTASAGTLRLDGAPVATTWTSYASGGFSYTQLVVAAGAHTLTATDIFIPIVWGEKESESYGYVAGYGISGTCTTDTDGDGLVDTFDLDSDGNGIFDVEEAGGADVDHDGIADGPIILHGVPSSAGGGLRSPDTDGDGILDPLDIDNDDDGVLDPADSNRQVAVICHDLDDDGCDDCSITGANRSGGNVLGDGPDFDGDSQCDAGDPDDDNDGVLDPVDSDPANSHVCSDDDDDSCDDCARGTFTPTRDGADLDGDGLCDVGDADDDNDGVFDALDSDDRDPRVCSDGDGDGCDDCAGGTFDPASDGADFDGDGQCDVGDPDDDNDGAPDAADSDPLDSHVCSDGDGDGCDDCAGGTFNPASDGPDNDGDGQCNASDPDDDNDGVPDAADSDDCNPHVCGDSDGDTCDDCAGGTFDPASDGPDLDRDGRCNDGEDLDGDGVPDDRDLDADNDGIPNRDESPGLAADPLGDADGDGIVNYLDATDRGDGKPSGCLDPDADGFCDGLASVFDIDHDGMPDHLDLDSDGDTIPDAIEAGHGAPDADGDGFVDGPYGANGLADAVEIAPGSGKLTYVLHDTDGDHVPDFADLDSDDDGRPDLVEARHGLVDADGDSIPGPYDADDAAPGAGDSNGDAIDDDDQCSAGWPRCADADHDGQPDYAERADRDGDGAADGRDLDTDNDGIPNAAEDRLGLDPLADHDGDGIANYADPSDRGDGTSQACADGNGDGLCDRAVGLYDTDGDGVPNHADLDSDNDGIPDVVEAGYGRFDANRDGQIDGPYGANGLADSIETAPESGISRHHVLDTDGDRTPDFLDLDSDGDGWYDLAEVAGLTGLDFSADHGDGRLDSTTDADRDGLMDTVDAQDDRFGFPTAATDPRASDLDGDRIPDAYDPASHGPGSGDSDRDGIIDLIECPGGWVCMDADRDGTPDYMEENDADGDGLRDSLDPDADNDGVGDAAELGGLAPYGDADHDGLPNYIDADDRGDGLAAGCADADGNGICDALAPVFDPDGDGLPNHLDLDSDGDTISDLAEAGQIDTDGDGVPDRLDLDSDGDGILDRDEAGDAALGTSPVDSDGDGIVDYRDFDSDGDGILDRDEAGDANLATPPVDSDGDGVPDVRDLDADGDGASDALEAGDRDLVTAPIDSDGDGRPDFQDPDADNDGRLDASDNCRIVANGDQLDGDGDGVGDLCDRDTDGNGFPDDYDITGGGCATGSGTTGLGGLLLVAATLWTARRRRMVYTAAIAAAGAAGTAAAQPVQEPQDFPAERLRLGADRTAIFDVETGAVPAPGSWDLGLWMGVSNDPLTVSMEDGERVGSLIKNRIGGELAGAYTPLSWLHLGVSAPLVVSQSRDSSLAGLMSDLPALQSYGIGDVRLSPKLRVLRGPLDIAVIPELTLPTGRGSAYLGEKGVSFAPAIAISSRVGRVVVAVDFGWRLREQTRIVNTIVDDELFARVGLGVRVAGGLELAGSFGAVTAAATPLAARRNQAEVIGGPSYTMRSGVQVFAAAGAGVDVGYATPDWRALVGIRIGKLREPREERIARIVVEADRGDLAEPGPAELPAADPDGDGIAGAADRCPDTAEDRDGFEDGDGCPDLDNDGDRIADAEDRCVDQAGPIENRGCPDGDGDGDGLVDRLDTCPAEPGPPEHGGCERKPLAAITSTGISVADVIRFDTGKVRIKSRSRELLDGVVRVLAAHPEVSFVRIEGHTDELGNAAANLSLSRRRAQAVRGYLIWKGIAEARLGAVGLGGTQPVVGNTSTSNRALDRRIELHIEPIDQVDP